MLSVQKIQQLCPLMQCQVAETDSKVQAKMLSLCMAELIDALMTMSCLATTAVVLKHEH